MRVTDASANNRSLTQLQLTSSRLADLQTQLTSGKQITKPSDDPSGTVKALQLRADLRRNEQYNAGADDAISWMATSDAAYTRMVQLVQTARTAVVQGLNSGAQSQSARDAIADQVDGIRSTLIGLANTTYNGRPVFGGTTAGTTAYDAAGNYVGDSGTVLRTVGAQSSVQVNQTGPQVFGPAGSDLFSTLSTISSQLRANSPGLNTQLTALDSAITTISTAQATEGATYQRVQATQTATTTQSQALTVQLSNIQDVDIADMAIKVSTANVNYQAALQTTAGIRQISLLNFLR